MTSRDLIDPDLLPGLEAIPDLPLNHGSIGALQAKMAAMMEAMPLPASDAVRIEEIAIPSPEGHAIGLVIHRPAAASATPRAAVLHIHGGGYVIGSARMSVPSNLQLALDTDSVIVSVDYRLAPATAHPGPVEDCYAALVWLAGQADALGVDPTRIAVMGESAGGGLAAALALLARDRGGPAICHQHLIYPMIDDRTCTAADPHPHAGQVVWDNAKNHFGWGALLGHEPGREGVSPYAAAARAEDLAGLPPAFISVGALDLFIDEDMDYARRLMRAGVPTELHVWPGAYHGFEMVADAPLTRRAKAASLAALQKALR